ncbi:hypothetical protein BGO17_00680 [Candidatus Saccharibacteria bacterium 49-20]|nr:hypothetical protein [Candidatus Saccharibacteria bacterium]OJU87499.1 MAG: hypothetical protein BGO17_00680 [Candidatus Saccharibacteria bacterium 49-20]OJU97104.1 MAG: hypothetical protein BGO18_02915 [Candidatus Saccharibacteria bacterium 47-87]
MSRPKGSKNVNPPAVPDTVNFTTEERLTFIATLIVERIIEDIKNEQPLLKKIGQGDATN